MDLTLLHHIGTPVALLGLAAVSLGLWWRGVLCRRELIRFEELAEQERREKQMAVEFLHNLTKDIDTGKGREALYAEIVQAALRGTSALGACLFEPDSAARLTPAAVAGLFPPQKPLPEKLRKPDALRADLIDHALRVDWEPDGDTLIGAVARDGKARFIPDAQHSPDIVRIDDPALRTRSLIVAPISFGGRRLGVLAVANPEHEHPFDAGDFSFVKSLGEQCALALHLYELFQIRAEKTRIDFDLAIASGVQKLLLPQKLPHSACLDMHACYRPAKQVGGDLYDVSDMGEGRIGVIAADVSGKGVSASLVMAMAHTHLRHLLRHCHSPGELLRRLNADMLGEIQRGMFITIACAIIDTRNHTLTLARAGHEPPLLLTKGEGPTPPRFEKIKTDGMAIGMVPPAVFDEILNEVTLPFRPGSVLVFFTDGLTEARNPSGEEYGTNRLADTLLRTHQYGARDLNQEILSSLETFCQGTALHDDLTLVTVKSLKED